jgi:hypothetical protein
MAKVKNKTGANDYYKLGILGQATHTETPRFFSMSLCLCVSPSGAIPNACHSSHCASHAAMSEEDSSEMLLTVMT